MKQLVIKAVVMSLIINSVLYSMECCEENEEKEVAMASPPKQRKLLRAIQSGDKNRVSEVILGSGAQINFSSNEIGFKSPLYTAITSVSEQYFDIIELLLEHGAHPTSEDINAAIQILPKGSNNCRLVKLLFEARTAAYVQGAVNPLTWAINKESPKLVELLIKYGVDQNITMVIPREETKNKFTSIPAIDYVTDLLKRWKNIRDLLETNEMAVEQSDKSPQEIREKVKRLQKIKELLEGMPTSKNTSATEAEFLDEDPCITEDESESEIELTEENHS